MKEGIYLESIDLVKGQGFIKTTVSLGTTIKIKTERVPRKPKHFCIKGDACIEKWGFKCKESDIIPLPRWITK